MKLRIEQLNLYLLITYIIANIIELFSKPEIPILLEWVFYVGPFIAGLIFFLSGKGLESQKTNYITYIIMGLFITLFGSVGNTTGVLFLCFAISMQKNTKELVKLIIIMILVISLKKFNQHMTIGEVINFILLYGYFIIADHLRISKIKKNASLTLEKNYSISSIPQDIIDIISLRIQGFDYPEINEKLELNITDERVSRKVSDYMKRSGFHNREQFMFYLTEKGIIRSIMDKPDT